MSGSPSALCNSTVVSAGSHSQIDTQSGQNSGFPTQNLNVGLNGPRFRVSGYTSWDEIDDSDRCVYRVVDGRVVGANCRCDWCADSDDMWGDK